MPELRNNLEGNLAYEKITFSAYTGEVASSLEKLGRKKIIIVEWKPMFVFSDGKDLIAQGFQVYVVQDAVCSRAKENYKMVFP